MSEELTIKIAGEAGQGIETLGLALCKLIKCNGWDLFANQDYMSRIRGGNNFFQLRIGNRPLYALRKQSDIIAALDKKSASLYGKELTNRAVVILDKKKFNIRDDEKVFFDLPFYDLAKTTGGSELFVNSVVLGVISKMIGIQFVEVIAVLKSVFSDKGQEVIEKNIAAAKAGYDYSVDNFRKNSLLFKRPSAKSEEMLLNGNDAIALGAIRAGCKFYSAYPMSPSTGIMNTIASYARDFHIVVEQAEDEIAAINMVIGASFAGVRSMTATSGGGFCLMVEGLSLAGMTETPLVVVDAQRPAPATGFPTRTEQADLDFLIHAGHGEFARAIFAPGTIEQAFYLTVRAFNLAEKYQIPVLLMTDQHLADSYRNISSLDLTREPVKRFIISREESRKVTGYKRYRLTASGVSPLAIPSWIDEVIYADSDEHTEEGHITEEASLRRQMVEKRFYKKMQGLARETERPCGGNLKGAKVILLGFGSTYGVMKEASGMVKGVGFLHLSQLWPFPSKQITALLRGARRIVTVENNAAGQLGRLLRRETGIKVKGEILKFDGRPFDLDYLIGQLKRK